MSTAPPAVHPRSVLRNTGSGSLMPTRRKTNLQLDESNSGGPSTTVSEPPPSPHQAYFDKYPKRAERIRERNNSTSNSNSKEDKDKHVTIEFPTMQDRKSSWSRQGGGGLRDWRVVQAHLEPKVPKKKDKETGHREKIRDPDDMVIVSLATAHDHDRTPPANTDPYSHNSNSSAPHLFDHVPPSPSVISGFRSSVISSAGTLNSSAATEPGALTPPRTPTSPHEPVLIASSSVEAMDALIDSMGMGSSVSLDTMSFLTPSYARSSRFAYPLYQPPLPTPPEGVKLGIVQDTNTMDWKSTKPKGKRPDKSPRRKEWREDLDDTETEAERRTPSSSTSRTGTPSTTAPSSRTGTPAPPSQAATTSAPIRVKSDEEIEADERADVTSPLVPPTRVRQRSGVSTRSARSARNPTPSVRSGVSGRTISTGSAGSSVHRARTISRSTGTWDLASSADGETESIDAVLSRGERVKERSVVPSIDDIIKMHAPAVVAATKAASQRSATIPKPPDSSPSKPVEADDLFAPGHSGLDPSRSSVDSIADEAQRSLQALQDVPPPPPPPVGTITPRRPRTANPSVSAASTPTSAPRLQHARSFASSAPAESVSLSPCVRAPFSDGASICSGNSGTTVVLARSPITADPTMEMAQYLRSPRLTRLLTLRRPAHAGLTVSLADVGSLTGRPVIVYLGLGCVRYLVALYDEMAEALNLRLICIDRWGLGRTTDVPTDKRGLLEWAGVVEEVADTLGLKRYSVLAHSAGAPYALAGSLKAGERVMGSVHLLAPWVSMAVDGGYKWLKYVPNGLIKTAQAAEWRLQGWMIGKPPTIQYEGIGFDASAPMSPGRMSFSSFSEYDELDDFDGRFGSRTTLALGEGKEAGKEKGAKDKVNVGGKEKEKEKVGGTKEKEKAGGSVKEKAKDKRSKELVSELGESRPRKGSKSIFGGLFNNTVPKGAPKRGPSTPPSAHATIKAKGPVELEDVPAEESSEPAPAIPEPELEPEPESPTTPIPPPPKLKGLRSMSSLKSRSAKSEPGKHTPVGLGLGFGIDDADARTQAWASEFAEADRPRQRRSLSLNARPGLMSPTTPAPPSPRSPGPNTTPNANANPKTVTLASALLQASHAESLKGGTADLLSILERDSKPWGFSYADVRQPVRVWYGDRDDKIGIGSVRWMERVMKSCEVKIVKGAGHSLMTNAEVVVEVLESIAKEWDQ